MTRFERELFNYHGGFLVYLGDYDGRPVYEDDGKTHPTRVGKGKDLFIARFKWNRGDKAGFLTFLIKHFTVEEYAERMIAGETPVGILESRGYVSASKKRFLKEIAA